MTEPRINPETREVTIPWFEYAQLRYIASRGPFSDAIDGADVEDLERDAAAWRLLCSSPHIASILAEWVRWDRRKTARETSWAVSGACDWRAMTGCPTYAELARRRSTYSAPARSPEQIRAECDASWARVEEWIGRRAA